MKEKIIYFLLVLILTIFILDIPSYVLFFLSQSSDLLVPKDHWSIITIPSIALFVLLIVLGNILSFNKYRLVLLLLIILITPVNTFISGTYLYNDYFIEYNIYASSLVEKPRVVDIIFDLNAVILLVQFIIPFIILWKIKPVKIGKKYIVNIMVSMSIILMITTALKKEIYNNIPYIETINTYLSVSNDRKCFQKELQKYHNQHNTLNSLKVIPTTNSSRQQIFVLVIGGCQTNKHFSLYGYQRNTTPLLNELHDKLFLFQNVSSADENRYKSVSNMISFNNEERNIYNAVNIIDLFKNAGFKTYWLSNHYIYEYNNVYNNIIGSSADEYLFTDNGYNSIKKTQDEVLIEYYDKIVHNNVEKKLIILHLIGSCGNLSEEYNEEYNYFYNKFADEKEIVVNKYDNTIVQVDYTLNRIIEGLEISNSEAYMLYLPDSSIDLEENKTEISNIPFILWLSEEYKKSYPATLRAVNNNLEKAYKVDTLMHSLTDLTQINYDKQDKSMSIFSNEYIEKDIKIDDKVVHKK